MKFTTFFLAGALVAVSSVNAANCDALFAFGKPVVTTTEKVTYLCRKMYVVEHSPSRHTPYWAAERIIGTQQNVAEKRVNAFKADPNLPKKEAAQLADYLYTGYDKGHMAAVGNMKIDPAAMRESFYLSNMVPQDPTNNSVGWRILEDYIRQLSIARSELYVITGPIYKGKIETIGDTKVAVPSHLFKVVIDLNKKAVLSFIVPNEPITQRDLVKYIVPMKEVEKAAGITLFPLLQSTKLHNSKNMWTVTTSD